MHLPMKKLLALLTILCLAALSGFGQSIRNIDETVVLRPDGSARVTQVWDVTVVSGTEFYLPFAVNDMIGRGEATVRMLTTPDRWHGVTYREDKAEVQAAIRQLIDAGVYPETLY